LEASLEERVSKLEHEEVPKEDAVVETFGALKAWGSASSHKVPQSAKWTQGSCGYQKKLVTAQGWLTCHVIPAWCKGHSFQGQGKDKAVPRTQKEGTFGKRSGVQPECNNGIRDHGAFQQLRLRKEMITENGIRGQTSRQELCLGSMKTLYEVLGQTLESEVVK
jgi:hypothetical protein